MEICTVYVEDAATITLDIIVDSASEITKEKQSGNEEDSQVDP